MLQWVLGRRLLLLLSLSIALHSNSAAIAADPANGADIFKKCRACHLVGDNAKHAVGPALNGIVGSKAGSADGYAYSDNLRELGHAGMLWTEEQLGRYLENPKAVVPKGKMAFPGLADPQDRVDLIAYLKTLAKP